MNEIAILHVCPHCQRVFDSPSVCMEAGKQTVPTPMVVTRQQYEEMTEITTPFEDYCQIIEVEERDEGDRPDGGEAA